MLAHMAAKKKSAKTPKASPAAAAKPPSGPKMKLAEALLLRADMQKKIESLRGRVVANAIVQDGEKPHEDPRELLLEAAGALDALESLVTRIHRANLTAKLPDGRTLTEAIARRDKLTQHHAILTAAVDGCRKEPDRYGVREIKWIATLEVTRLQKQKDDLAKTLRELNGAIQETNWQVEIDG